MHPVEHFGGATSIMSPVLLFLRRCPSCLAAANIPVKIGGSASRLALAGRSWSGLRSPASADRLGRCVDQARFLERQDSCPVSMISQSCVRGSSSAVSCSVEVAAPADADERPGDGNGQMPLPVPGHQSTRHWTNAIKGISPPVGGEQEGEEDMERRLDDVIAALPE